MTLVTIITLTDHRERTTPFGILGRYLAQLRKSNLFLVAVYYFSLHFCSSYIFAQPLKTLHKEKGVDVSLLFQRLPYGILGTLVFSKWAIVWRVNGVIIAEISQIPLHFLHFRTFEKCKNAESANDFQNCCFRCPYDSGLVQSHIYTSLPNQTKIRRW